MNTEAVYTLPDSTFMPTSYLLMGQ